MKSLLTLLVFHGTLAIVVGTAPGAHMLWDIAGQGNWTDAGNWNTGVPGNTDSAEIGQGAGNGGKAIVNTTVDDILYWYLGESSGQTGTLEIQPGGSLTTTQSTGHYVGRYGTGNLIVTGGSLDVSAGHMYVGFSNPNGTGTVTQSGGTVSVAQDTYLSEGSSSTGYYELSGGAVTSSRFLVGLHGTGQMDHTGGTLTVTAPRHDLSVAWYDNGHGTYNLSGPTSQIIVEGSGSVLVVGRAGTGVFNQSDGSVTAEDRISVGYNSTGHGTCNLSGGTVSARTVYVGYDGTGVFNQTGGIVSTSGSEPHVWVGYNSTSHGTYEISGETTQLNVGDDLVVGNATTGIFRQSGGTVNITDYAFVGYGGTGNGTYELSGGELNAAYRVSVGYYNGSTGTCDVSGGRLAVNNIFYLGYYGGSTGVCNLSGGEIAAYNAYLGNSGTGTLRQNGGEFNVTNDIYINVGAGGLGTYEMDGGNVSSRRLLVGLHGTGVFTQTGGDVYVRTGSSPDLTIAWYSDGVGTYTLSGGNVSARQLRNGNSGTGLLRIIGDDAVILTDYFRQNAASTLETLIDNDGISTIDVSGNASLNGDLDVNLHGGVALLSQTAFDLITTTGSISGNFNDGLDTEPLWDVAQASNYVRAQIDVPDRGPLAVDYHGLAEIEIDGGAGTNVGYTTVTGIDPALYLWMLLDVEKNSVDLSGAELTALADHVGSGGHTVSTDLALLGSGSMAAYNLAILFDPVPASSSFAWDFSDYDADLRVTHVAAGIPEPASLILWTLGVLLFVGHRWRWKR